MSGGDDGEEEDTTAMYMDMENAEKEKGDRNDHEDSECKTSLSSVPCSPSLSLCVFLSNSFLICIFCYLDSKSDVEKTMLVRMNSNLPTVTKVKAVVHDEEDVGRRFEESGGGQEPEEGDT